MAEVAIPRASLPTPYASSWNCGRRLSAGMNDSPIHALGREVRPDEGEIDIPGLERTAVADLGAWQPYDHSPRR